MKVHDHYKAAFILVDIILVIVIALSMFMNMLEHDTVCVWRCVSLDVSTQYIITEASN